MPDPFLQLYFPVSCYGIFLEFIFEHVKNLRQHGPVSFCL